MPKPTGSGNDAYGKYNIVAGVFRAETDSLAFVQMTKQYEDGSQLTLATKMKLPIQDTFFGQWTYRTSGSSDLNTVLGLGNTGSIFMLLRKPAHNDYILEGETVNFGNADAKYSVSLYPEFAGNGEDSLGDFELTGRGHVNGNKVHLTGYKTYKQNGKVVGQYKLRLTLPYPALSMSGNWVIENMQKGTTERKEVSMERLADNCYGPEKNIMTVKLSNSETVTFTTPNMIWLPVVSGQGSSAWGDYSINGDYDPETGVGSYRFSFTNGQECVLNAEPTTGAGPDMMGYAQLRCTADIGDNVSDAVWTSTTGEYAYQGKFATDASPGSTTIERSTGKVINQSGVFGYFPKINGHGQDGKGKYTIQMAKNTKLNAPNRYAVVYDNGLVDWHTGHITLGKDGKYIIKGNYVSSPSGQRGSYTATGEVRTEQITGFCLAEGASQPEPWLWSWPRRDNCPYPWNPEVNCAAQINICDSWEMVTKERITHNVVSKNKRYGFAMKIAVPEQYWTSQGWTIALRFPAGQAKLEVDAWNAAFLDVYETSRETVVVMTARAHLATDRTDPYSFMVTISGLRSHDRPSMLFWPYRNRNGFCYNQQAAQFARTSAGRASTNQIDQALAKQQKPPQARDNINSLIIRRGKVSNIGFY